MNHEPYSIIYADPPWWYASRSSNHKTKFGGGARAHYPVMRDGELLAMQETVQPIMADNCALLMWATMPRLDFAIELLKHWGDFGAKKRSVRYATKLLTWVKTDKRGRPIYGPGHYSASNDELLLLGVRGSMRVQKRMVPSVIFYPRMRHSEKPPIVRDIIVDIFGDLPRIELFARHSVPGWDTFGNEPSKLETPAPKLVFK